MEDINRIRKMMLLPRCAACSSELVRSASALWSAGQVEAAEGTLLMAETLSEITGMASNQARIAERLAMSSRFLLDMLQLSNEEVEALYGRTDTLEQAALELRDAIKAQEGSRASAPTGEGGNHG